MPVAQTQNEQVIEALVSGPGGASRLLTCTGRASTPGLFVSQNQGEAQRWTFLVGPPLQQSQFHRATASVAVAAYQLFVVDPTATGMSHSVETISVEADWDDESGRTEIRAEIALNAGAGTNYYLNILSYSATVLAGS